MSTIYYGGIILTMERALYQPAMLTENGRILSFGSKEALLARAPHAQTVDLKGHTLMPSFIDPHSHFTQVANATLQVSFQGLTTAEEMRAAVTAFIAARKPSSGSFIIAKEYDHNFREGARHLTLAEADVVCPDYPLIIQHSSGHMGIFNSRALDALGVSDQSPAVDGGLIGKTDGHLNGYMEENAYYTYLKKAPLKTPEELLAAFVKAQQIYAENGITTLQEGMFVEQMIPLYQLLLSKNVLKLDLVAYSDIPSLDKVHAAFPHHFSVYQSHLRFGGIKIFLDGSPQGRTAWMRAPYLGEPADYRAYGTLSYDQVMSALRIAAENQCQILAHCNGDAASALYLRAMADAEQAYPLLRSLRPVIIHAQLLGLDQIPEAAKLDMIASFFVAHVYHWGDVHIKNFGLDRAAHISPAASAQKAGLLYTFHQDAPVVAPNMLETIHAAVNRVTKDGISLGESERVNVLDALKAVTSNAAYQYFEEDEKGVLAPGKRADLVILSENPLDVPLDRIKELQVLETIKDGETVYRR